MKKSAESWGEEGVHLTNNFAQMAKSDQHMNKIKAKLLSKAQEQERPEIKKLREFKKYGKKVQVEVQQKRQKKKKEMLEEVTKMRKGQGGNLDFLDNKDSKGKVGGKSRRKTSRIKSLGLVEIRET